MRGGGGDPMTACRHFTTLLTDTPSGVTCMMGLPLIPIKVVENFSGAAKEITGRKIKSVVQSKLL